MTSSQGGVRKQLTTARVCLRVRVCGVHVHPLLIHIMYRMRNMFSPSNLCTHPKMEAHANRRERSTFRKEAQLMENERPPALGTGSLLGPALTSTVGASTLDSVHPIPPMMSKG